MGGPWVIRGPVTCLILLLIDMISAHAKQNKKKKEIRKRLCMPAKFYYIGFFLPFFGGGLSGLS